MKDDMDIAIGALLALIVVALVAINLGIWRCADLLREVLQAVGQQ